MDIDKAKAIYSTLNTIEVKGRENLSSLLGCIDAVGDLIRSEELKKLRNPEGSDGR